MFSIYMKKVLLDTDIGDDIDDALALGYLGQSKDIDLLGVSTVFLKTRERAELCAAELQVLNEFHIPVVPGAGRPLKIENAKYNRMLREHKPRQFEVLSKIKPMIKPYEMDVVEFLKNNIEAYPKEVTLLTIGPLTNAGLFI
jgi:inosine-uridine nucleoside N-ribohydrolase